MKQHKRKFAQIEVELSQADFVFCVILIDFLYPSSTILKMGFGKMKIQERFTRICRIWRKEFPRYIDALWPFDGFSPIRFTWNSPNQHTSFLKKWENLYKDFPLFWRNESDECYFQKKTLPMYWIYLLLYSLRLFYAKDMISFSDETKRAKYILNCRIKQKLCLLKWKEWLRFTSYHLILVFKIMFVKVFSKFQLHTTIRSKRWRCT